MHKENLNYSELDYTDQIFIDTYGVTLTKEAHNIIDRWEKLYGPAEVCTAFVIAADKYDDPDVAFDKVGGILFNRSGRRKYTQPIENGMRDES